MIKTLAFAGMVLIGSLTAAYAVVPIVNPLTVNLGTPVHLTPIDQNSTPVPINQCTIVGFPSAGGLPTSLVTVSYDATGGILTAVGTGSGLAQWKCVNGSAVVTSVQFTVTVPWSVTAVGDTMP